MSPEFEPHRTKGTFDFDFVFRGRLAVDLRGVKMNVCDHDNPTCVRGAVRRIRTRT